jgi:phage/plasmid-associated DNA primase
VQGALKYRSEGLTKPEEIKKQNAEYREDSDPEESVTSWLTQFSSPANNDWMKSSVIYAHYYNWCLEGGIKALGIKGFSISLSKDDKGFERRLSAGYKEFRRKVTPVKSVKIGKDDNSF